MKSSRGEVDQTPQILKALSEDNTVICAFCGIVHFYLSHAPHKLHPLKASQSDNS